MLYSRKKVEEWRENGFTYDNKGKWFKSLQLVKKVVFAFMNCKKFINYSRNQKGSYLIVNFPFIMLLFIVQ